MLKKMMLLALSVAALVAFAAPAMAQADELVDSEGPLPIGAEVTATSTNLVTKSALGELKCTFVTIHAEVAENGPSIHLNDLATTTAGCNVAITNPTAGTITLEGGTGLATGATFVAAGACDFAGNIPFSYATGTSSLTVTGTNQLSAPSPCGTATMSGSFNLETSGGEAVTIE